VNDGSRRYLLLVGVSLVLIALDQITKMFVMHTMHLHESIPVIPDFFNLTYIRNPGAAFGIFATTNSAFRLIFFVGTSIFALGLLGTNDFLPTPRRRRMGPVNSLQHFWRGDRQSHRSATIRRSRRLSRFSHQRLPLARLQRRR